MRKVAISSEDAFERLYEKLFPGIGFRCLEKSAFWEVLPSAFQITLVIGGSSVDRAGLRRGDYIIKFDGLEVGSIQAKDKRQFFSDYVKRKNIQDAFPLDVMQIRRYL